MDRRARLIVNLYSKKFKTLDVNFAADVVGDGEVASRAHVKQHNSSFLEDK